jgi:hypothetical protein
LPLSLIERKNKLKWYPADIIEPKDERKVNKWIRAATEAIELSKFKLG